MEKIFRKSFRVELTIEAQDLECAEELFLNEYDIMGIYGDENLRSAHVLKVEVVDSSNVEEDILDADGKKIDIKYH